MKSLTLKIVLASCYLITGLFSLYMVLMEVIWHQSRIGVTTFFSFLVAAALSVLPGILIFFRPNAAALTALGCKFLLLAWWHDSFVELKDQFSEYGFTEQEHFAAFFSMLAYGLSVTGSLYLLLKPDVPTDSGNQGNQGY